MGGTDALAAIWIYVADSSCRGYSPIYDRICGAVAESDAVLDLVTEAPPEGHNPVLLLAAVHHLLLGGLEHPSRRGRSQRAPGLDASGGTEAVDHHQPAQAAVTRRRPSNGPKAGRLHIPISRRAASRRRRPEQSPGRAPTFARPGSAPRRPGCLTG